MGILDRQTILKPVRRITPLDMDVGGSARAVAAVATPTPPGSPLLWYDFTDITQLFQDTGGTSAITTNGQGINLVTDKGSAGVNADTSTGACLAAIYNTTGINGYSAADFTRIDTNNGSGFVSISGINFSSDSMVLIVAQQDTPGNGNGMPVVGPEGTAIYYAFQNQSTIQMQAASSKATQTKSSFTSGNWAGWAKVSVNSGTVSLSLVPGTDSKAYGVGDPDVEVIGIGTYLGTGFFATQNISEVLFWDATLPATADVETYVTDKYGITWA